MDFTAIFWILTLRPKNTYSHAHENQLRIGRFYWFLFREPTRLKTELRNPRSTSMMPGTNANWTSLMLWCITYISILHGFIGREKHNNLKNMVSDSSRPKKGVCKAMGIPILVKTAVKTGSGNGMLFQDLKRCVIVYQKSPYTRNKNIEHVGNLFWNMFWWTC